MIGHWAAFVARRAGLVLAAGVAVVVAASLYGVGVFSALSDGGFDDPQSQSSREVASERAVFPGHEAMSSCSTRAQT